MPVELWLRTGDPHSAPERSVFPGTEWEPLDVPLDRLLRGSTLDLYPEIASGRYIGIRFKGDQLSLTAAGYVGLIPLNDRVAIEVEPRVRVANLERLFAVAKGQPLPLRRHVRGYAPNSDAVPSLLEMLAQALVDSTDPIETYGLHREEVERRYESTYPRGRILLGATTQRFDARGIRHRAVVSRFERTVDNAPNRCLKYALWLVAQRYSRVKQLTREQAQLLARTNRSLHTFDGVSLEPRRDWLSDLLVRDPSKMPPIRQYYEDALYLALAIVSENSLRFREEGELRLPSLVLNMHDLFESYLREVLRRQIGQLPGRHRVLDGNLAAPAGGQKGLFDEEPTEDANPDIVIRPASADAPVVIVEVKYKPFDASGAIERDDLNQVIAYGASYRARAVVVAQPIRDASSKVGLSKVGTIGPLTIYGYGYDLGASNLASTEVAFGRCIHGLLA